MILTKNLHPQPKKFYRVQTRRLAVSFELLNSSLLLSVPELRSRKATCDPVVLVQKSSKPTGDRIVNAKSISYNTYSNEICI